MKRLVVFALGLALAGCVTPVAGGPVAGGGPVVAAPTMPSYVTIHAEVASKFPNTALVAPSGLSVDWGGFQSKYVAAGTSLGVSRDDPELGTAILIGGGPQFHVPLGSRALLIPALNLAYRLSSQGFGLAAYASLGAAYKFDRMYAGLEAETPLVLQQPAGNFAMFPGAVEIKAMLGFYY